MSENLPNSPNKMSENCYGMKFDLSDDQSLRKRHPMAHFNRWAKMGVVCNHVRNAALNGSNQFTLRPLFFIDVNENFLPLTLGAIWPSLSPCTDINPILLTLNLFKRCESKQLRTNFIDNFRVMLQKKQNKMADVVEEVSESQNALRQFKFKFKFKYFNFCCCNSHV